MNLPWWYFPALIGSVAMMLTLRFGHALRAVLRRRDNETIEQAWVRGSAERDAYEHAVSHALGSPAKTVPSMYLAVMLFMYVVLWCTEDRWYGYVGGLYFAIGVVVAYRLDLAHGEHWPKLDPVNRTMCRVVHAWIWPVHAWWSRKSRSAVTPQ